MYAYTHCIYIHIHIYIHIFVCVCVFVACDVLKQHHRLKTQFPHLHGFVVSAEYSGAVDACILNIEKDGSILFSWKVNSKCSPLLKHTKATLILSSVAFLPVWFPSVRHVFTVDAVQRALCLIDSR